jgi:hypothetical protein
MYAIFCVCNFSSGWGFFYIKPVGGGDFFMIDKKKKYVATYKTTALLLLSPPPRLAAPQINCPQDEWCQ